MTIIKEYLHYQEKYEKIYGKEKTLVLMCVGSFFEAYSTVTRGHDLTKISELLNIILTKKDKKIQKVDEKNPYMLGVPTLSLEKYLKKLVENGYTVIIYDQTTPPPNPKRELTGIYSPGTYLSDTNNYNSNNIVCMYIEDEIQKNNNYLTCIGISVIDLSTGESIVQELYSSNGDEKNAMDDAYRILLTFSPKEIIIYRKDNKNTKLTKEKIYQYLEIENKNCHYYDYIDKNYFKINYQNEFLSKIYKEHGMLSCIEYLDLEKMPYATLSLVLLLDFVYKHNSSFVYNVDKPKIFTNGSHMILGNDAIYQLNLLPNESLDVLNNKFRCLFDVLNNASTPMGKRFLKYTLCLPLKNTQEIQKRYDCIEEVIKKHNEGINDLEKHLNGVLDIERLFRKMSMLTLNPFELANLIESMYNIKETMEYIKKSEFMKLNLPNKKTEIILNEFIQETKIFNLDELKKYTLKDLKEITQSFFIKGQFSKIDELHEKNIGNILYLENVCKNLSLMIKDKNNFGNKNSENDLLLGGNKISLKKNRRDGYYLSLTKIRATALKKKINELEEIKLENNYKINSKDLEFKELEKGKTKIFLNKILNKKKMDNEQQDDSSDEEDLYVLKEKFANIMREKYIEKLSEFSKKYADMFRDVTYFISIIDFIKAGAKTAMLYNYSKPKILDNKEGGFIKCKNLRHPIVERIRTDIEYVPNDIELGMDMRNIDSKNGMLLYSVNSCGKSTLAKSIGISVIMAQSGLYVAAEDYEYSPYENLFARITGNDNLFKGLSSFGLEMTELKSILKRSGSKTLVIGDEVTRGTEQVSGNAIVAATLIKLSEAKATYIFATHLHDLVKMKRVQNLEKLRICHLTVDYDTETDNLIFNRKLKEGSGDTIYGLTIAKYILKNDEFIDLANQIKDEILNTPKEILCKKKSKYNNKIYVDSCAICGILNNRKTIDHSSILDTHHINNQKDCEFGFSKLKPHLPMNSEANLIVLCKECHYKVHHNQLEINGYKSTAKGKVIDYKFL